MSETRNPLTLFPSKSVGLAKLLHSGDVRTGTSLPGAEGRFVFEDRIAGDFGLAGDSEDARVRRAFRRLESR